MGVALLAIPPATVAHLSRHTCSTSGCGYDTTTTAHDDHKGADYGAQHGTVHKWDVLKATSSSHPLKNATLKETRQYKSASSVATPGSCQNDFFHVFRV